MPRLTFTEVTVGEGKNCNPAIAIREEDVEGCKGGRQVDLILLDELEEGDIPISAMKAVFTEAYRKLGASPLDQTYNLSRPDISYEARRRLGLWAGLAAQEAEDPDQTDTDYGAPKTLWDIDSPFLRNQLSAALDLGADGSSPRIESGRKPKITLKN